MFERISNGFSMAQSSWRVLMQDKKLLVFPVISGILSLLILATFIVPTVVLHQQGKLLDANGQPHQWTYLILFAYYVLAYAAVIFCNSALIACALLRFDGQDATLGDGLRVAMARLPQIFAWAMVSATVGVILHMIENANEKVGYFIKSILGTAWSLMTYFVVPVLVVEKLGPIDAVKRSTSLLSRTWGEALVGKIGLGLFLFLAAIPIILLFVVAFVVVGQMPALGIALLVVAALALLLYCAVSSAMNTIFLTAVYQYAAFHRAPAGFEEQTLARAFGKKA
jgi:hypothetical protein